MKCITIKVLLLLLVCAIGQTVDAQTISYTMPAEHDLHEGTWLQWPHNNLYGPYYRDDLEPTWIEMTRELVQGENVHIIAYDASEQSHIQQALTQAGVSLQNVDFYVFQNDDCWVRDNGPIFAFDNSDNLVITDWGFNGWGNSTPYAQCDVIPAAVSQSIGVPVVDVNAMVLEGGAIEIDGEGTMFATKSSIVNSNRNPSLSQGQIEDYMTTNLGITNFVWLDGVAGLEITDMHIDGFVKVHDATTLVTMDSTDLVYWEVPAADIGTLYSAQNALGGSYNYVILPLTQNDVSTTWGQDLGYKGSYVNYYVGNAVVLVPTYNDPNDNIAINILQGIFPNRTVVGIDCRNLYSGGGMVHCVTQQQPASNSVGVSDELTKKVTVEPASPNPAVAFSNLKFELPQAGVVRLDVFNGMGQLIATVVDEQKVAGSHNVVLNVRDFAAGVYTYTISVDGELHVSERIIVTR